MPEESIGAWMKRNRLARRWTQAKVATLVGCTVPYISRLESGEANNPSHAIVLVLEKVLECPLPAHLRSGDMRPATPTPEQPTERAKVVYGPHYGMPDDDPAELAARIAAQTPAERRFLAATSNRREEPA